MKKETKFIIFMFFVFVFLAIVIPYNKAPDEEARYLLVKYMFQHNQLPLGTDPEVRIPLWGSSYAFSPFLSYMFGAVLMKCFSLFTTDPHALLVGARLSSVLCSTLTVYFIIKISDLLFSDDKKWIFILLCSCLPCFIFVSSYVNCDALAVLSTAIIIYSWIIGIRSLWDKKSCILLIIGLSLCVLSYKNAYGYILLSLLLYVYELYRSYKRNEIAVMLKKGFIIFICVLILGGWFYVRNYVLYGDFMGSDISTQLGELYAIDELKPSMRLTPYKSGVSLIYMLRNMEWIDNTYHSFIGKFGYMDLPLPELYYRIYNMIFCTGVIGLFIYLKNKVELKKDFLIKLLFVFSILIPVGLSIYYSYFEDFQAQGRYVLPILIPLMYFISKGIGKLMSYLKTSFQKYIMIIFTVFQISLVLYMLAEVFAGAYL